MHKINYNLRLVLLLILCCTFFFQCTSSKKIKYDIPANYPEARRKQILELCEQGKILYKNNCSQCHGIFAQGKDGIPDFSQKQLDNYSARFIRRDPENHASAINMTPEQLNNVLTFLRYKKRPKSDTTTVRRTVL